MLPFIGRLNLFQADKLYTNIFQKGIHVEQDNSFKAFGLIASCFLIFILKLYVIMHNNINESNVNNELATIKDKYTEDTKVVK